MHVTERFLRYVSYDTQSSEDSATVPTTEATTAPTTAPTTVPTTAATTQPETQPVTETTEPTLVEKVGGDGWIGVVIVVAVLTLLLILGLVLRGARHKGGKYSG